MVTAVNDLLLGQEGAGATGRARGLQRLRGQNGIIGVVAVDHGESFSRRLARLLGRSPSAKEVAVEKQRIMRHVAPAATGVVCDVGGLSTSVRLCLIPRDVALVAGLPDLPPTWSAQEHLPWSDDVVARVAASGCDAIKLCLLVDNAEMDRARLDLATDMSARCGELGIALVLEIVPSQDFQRRSGDWRPPAPVDGNAGQFAAEYGRAGPDVLKLHLPAAGRSDALVLEACRKVTDKAPCPWVVLSAGTTFEVFRHQLEIACKGGASGFVAGTAIWQEALEIPDTDARENFLATTAADRLQILQDVALASAARPTLYPLTINGGNQHG
jgi:tagatose-1,6-bisphosphate aldolase